MHMHCIGDVYSEWPSGKLFLVGVRSIVRRVHFLNYISVRKFGAEFHSTIDIDIWFEGDLSRDVHSIGFQIFRGVSHLLDAVFIHQLICHFGYQGDAEPCMSRRVLNPMLNYCLPHCHEEVHLAQEVIGVSLLIMKTRYCRASIHLR